MSVIKIKTNSLGSGDWIVVDCVDSFGTERWFEGHKITVGDLKELMYDAHRTDSIRAIEIEELTDEQMSEMEM